MVCFGPEKQARFVWVDSRHTLQYIHGNPQEKGIVDEKAAFHEKMTKIDSFAFDSLTRNFPGDIMKIYSIYL